MSYNLTNPYQKAVKAARQKTVSPEKPMNKEIEKKGEGDGSIKQGATPACKCPPQSAEPSTGSSSTAPPHHNGR